MKHFCKQQFLCLILLLLANYGISQSGSVRLGSQITNGIISGGCATPCVTDVPANDPTFICNSFGENNHAAQTMTHSIVVPQGNFLQLNVVTNECNGNTDGLDSGDAFSVNGVVVVTGNSNTRVNYSGCFENNGTTDFMLTISLTANRRDETVTASWTISTTNPGGTCSPLPVSLTAFGISAIGNNSILFFSTASETNNDYFTIERSADGRSFDAIGEIDGAGNSSEERHYEFTDESPLPGINYYRIKQTDYDGKYSYSEIRSVIHDGGQRISVTPKQTEGIVHITTSLEDYSVSVFSSAGQEVSKFSGISGYQTVDISMLQSGIYFVQVTGGSMRETVRLVKF